MELRPRPPRPPTSYEYLPRAPLNASRTTTRACASYSTHRSAPGCSTGFWRPGPWDSWPAPRTPSAGPSASRRARDPTGNPCPPATGASPTGLWWRPSSKRDLRVPCCRGIRCRSATWPPRGVPRLSRPGRSSRPAPGPSCSARRGSRGGPPSRPVSSSYR